MSKSKEQGIKDSYDVVIIGAGNGGLTAAAELAMRGVNLLLLEQHNLPGGFASSFVRGRFEFETSLHELYDWGPESNKGGTRRLLERYELDSEFVAVPEAYRLIVTNPDDYIDVVMPFGIDAYLDAIEKAVPGCRDSVRSFFDLAQEIDIATSFLGRSRGNPDQEVLLKEHSNFLKTAAYSVEEIEDALNIPEKAKGILNAYWLYLGIPTNRVNSTLFTSMVYGYILKGAYIPKFRSHDYTTALDAKIREFGGKIEYNTKVEKILVENGKIIGVETSNGDKIKTNHVISNASPTLTYNNLIHPKSEVPEIAYKEINARRHGISTFVVYMGLDATAEELGLKEYSYFISNIMNTEELYEELHNLEIPNVQATICLNNAIPDCSPPGTCIVSITSAFLPGAWDDVKLEEYFTVKNKIAEGLINNFEKATGAPIREHIEEIEVATPQTISRFTRAYNGVVYGYEPDSWDSIVPRLAMMNDDKHIDGLEFCGGHGKRAHGYSSSLKDGQTAALLTLQDLQKKGELK
ncbi:MAG: NAD(P)/FAD-dependent oxidoreductase [Candidatus Lokiarchaeota archaeon]|nr:NAD(P)/FAD-dependent oxidoreductase [Candidatus Lokiarchaeota archaeon]